jgi:hypothetical protein
MNEAPWWIVGAVAGGFYVYAYGVYRLAQIHRVLAHGNATLTCVHGRWQLAVTSNGITTVTMSRPLEMLFPFLYRITITQTRTGETV